MEIERLVTHCIDRGFRLHHDLGPGLLENVYETLLFESLRRDGLNVQRQGFVRVEHESIVIDNAFRFDLLVEDKLLIEIKSTEKHAPVHAKQVITYLRLMELPIGVLMNFGMGTFKDGCKRLVNNYERNRR